MEKEIQELKDALIQFLKVENDKMMIDAIKNAVNVLGIKSSDEARKVLNL